MAELDRSHDLSLSTHSATRWTVKPMLKSHLAACLAIWTEVDLTEAKSTLSSALETDPNGFYVAELDQSGEIVGMCTGAISRPDTAFVGFYAVKPAFQGQGIGRALWTRTIGRLDPSMNIGLNGVPDMSSKYRKSGFVVEDVIRMMVYKSYPQTEYPLDLGCLKDIEELLGCRLVSIDSKTDEVMFKKLLDYDHSVQKHSRETLLRAYLQSEDAPLTLAVVKDSAQLEMAKSDHSCSGYVPERKSSCCAKPNQEAIIENEPLTTTKSNRRSSSIIVTSGSSEFLIPRATSPIDIPSPTSVAGHYQQELTSNKTHDPEILGYGCIRLDNKGGGMIGPIYADSSDLCEVILRNLIDRFHLKPGACYTVMSLTSNKNSNKIVSKLGLFEGEQCSRMFTKFVPAASFSKIFYIHSPNFSLF